MYVYIQLLYPSAPAFVLLGTRFPLWYWYVVLYNGTREGGGATDIEHVSRNLHSSGGILISSIAVVHWDGGG